MLIDALTNMDLLVCILEQHACFRRVNVQRKCVNPILNLFSSCHVLRQMYQNATNRVIQQLKHTTATTRHQKHLQRLTFLNKESSIWAKLLKCQLGNQPASWSLFFRHDTPLLCVVCPHHKVVLHTNVKPLPCRLSCGNDDCPGFIVHKSGDVATNVLIKQFYWWCYHEQQHLRRLKQLQPSVKPKRPRMDHTLRTNGHEKKKRLHSPKRSDQHSYRDVFNIV